MANKEPQRLPKRSECRGPGLCTMIRCRYHLLLEVTSTGSLRLNTAQMIPRPGRKRMEPRHDTSVPLLTLDRDEIATARFLESAAERLTTMEHSCALDLADQGGVPLEQVGELLGMTRERVRQIEARALAKLAAAGFQLGQRDRR